MSLPLLASGGSERHPEGVVLTHPEATRSEQSAVRRAAARLEADGKIILSAVKIDGRSRLVACAPDADAPTYREVLGKNGKTYRVPT